MGLFRRREAPSARLTAGEADAVIAAAQCEQQLADVVAMRPIIDQVAESLAGIRRANNFAGRMRKAFEGGGSEGQ